MTKRQLGARLIPLAITLLIVGCGDLFGEDSNRSPSSQGFVGVADTPTPTGVRDKIVYVSNDFDVYTTSSDGTGVEAVTPGDLLYTWPVWTRYGDKVALSSFSENPTGSKRVFSSAVVPEHSSKDAELDLVFENEANSASAIALTIPHYLAWSPDGTKLALLTMATEGLSLYIVKPPDPGNAQFVTAGTPLYFSWSSDSESLLVHKDGELLRVDLDAPERLLPLGATSEGYRAPAWSPTGDNIVFISDTGEAKTLYFARFDASKRRELAQIDGMASFVWSPLGDKLAVGQSYDDTDPFLKDISIIDISSGQSSKVFEGSVISFFWSPDATKMAFVTTSDDGNALQWRVIDISSGSIVSLVDFYPSSDQLIFLTFFDQYAVSNNLWSPDSESLVFAGKLVNSAESIEENSLNKIFILDANGSREPRILTSGRLASWSWN